MNLGPFYPGDAYQFGEQGCPPKLWASFTVYLALANDISNARSDMQSEETLEKKWCVSVLSWGAIFGAVGFPRVYPWVPNWECHRLNVAGEGQVERQGQGGLSI
jgi:hypothetical protein